MKRVISILLILILCSSSSFADSSLTIDIDGKVSSIDGGITLIPAQDMFEALGAKVEWNRYAGEFTAIKDDTEIKIDTYSNYMTLNGSRVDLDEEVRVIDGRVYVSLEAITKSMNVEIEMDNKLHVKSEEQMEREYEKEEKSLYRKYPKLYKAIEKIMKKPFEQSSIISMKIANWKITDDNDKEYFEELVKNTQEFGIDIKSDSKIDYLNKKLESDTSVSIKQSWDKEENGLKVIVLDGIVYTKPKENKVEGMVWTKAELEEDKYFSNRDKMMKELVKFKDNIKRGRRKTDTIYTIEIDDGIQFDDVIDILGEDNAIYTQLKESNGRPNIKIKDFKLEYIIDDEGNLKNNDLSVILEVSDEEVTVEFLVTLKGEYKNIGRPLEISIAGDGEEELKKSIDLKTLQLKKDGKDISLDLEAIVVDSKILVPVEKVTELLEAEVSVDEVTGDIKIEKGNSYIIIRKNTDFALVNGFEVPMPLYLQERDGVNYVPLSFVVSELGGVAIIDSERSEINILSVEAVKRDFEDEQKEFEKKYPKLYQALKKLENEPFKQKFNFIDRVDNIKVDDRESIDRDDSHLIESKIYYLASYDFQGQTYDEVDIKNRIRKSRYEGIAAGDSEVYKSEFIVMDKKVYRKVESGEGYEASWMLFGLENDDKYFQFIYNSISLFINDIIEEKVEDGTKFTIRIDSTHENKAALERFIHDKTTVVPYGFSKDDCELKNLEVNYLVDKNGDMKSREIKYLIHGTYKTIQMDFKSETKAEYEEIGKSLKIEKPTNIIE
ncbi:copper amine oxidase N-terminal domain-containing protein [Wukongibacter baidiensis]|uniref:copper amine oxidase N-terminal domain-containing protein n=1 Tax=Wukongibacter baidiensis TaxID=1723361 RepID=UPI003D7F3200